MNSTILHFGSHRCGSTAIQDYIFQVRRAYRTRARRVKTNFGPNSDYRITNEPFLFDRNNLSAHPSLKYIYGMSYRSYIPFYDKCFLEKSSQCINRIAPMIFSDERLMGSMTGIMNYRFYPRAEEFFKSARQLRDRLDHPLKLVMGVRDQTKLIESLYAFRVYKGSQQSLPDFYSRLRLDDFNWSRFYKLAEKYDLIDCLHFYSVSQLSDDLMHDLFELEEDGVFLRKRNESLSSDNLSLFQKLNKIKKIRAAKGIRNQIRRYLTDFNTLPDRDDFLSFCGGNMPEIREQELCRALDLAAETKLKTRFTETEKIDIKRLFKDDNLWFTERAFNKSTEFSV